MSKGNRVILFRVSPELEQEMRERLLRRNATTAEAEWTLSDYIRYCVECDLRHRERSKKSRKSRATVADTLCADEGVGKKHAQKTVQTVQEESQ